MADPQKIIEGEMIGSMIAPIISEWKVGMYVYWFLIVLFSPRTLHHIRT